MEDSWDGLGEALAFAVSRIGGDADALNEREAADGNEYVLRILRAVADAALADLDPRRPQFLPMLESVRHLGACGPDIDYDVALVLPGTRYRIRGHRGGASYVGIAVYAGSGAGGASAIVASADVDDLVQPDGSFVFEFTDPAAARVIIRQYFHDRSAEAAGSWIIEALGADGSPLAGPTEGALRPTVTAVAGRVTAAAHSLRWNAQLNQLWSPELREAPNHFVRQSPDEIVAAVTNPDVIYATSWWRIQPDEALVIDLHPPQTRYWSLQVCDRWFQSFPQRRTNLNNRQVAYNADGTVTLVLAAVDPGTVNWLDTSGHSIGTMFFRWLHADPPVLPRCRLVPTEELAAIVATSNPQP